MVDASRFGKINVALSVDFLAWVRNKGIMGESYEDVLRRLCGLPVLLRQKASGNVMSRASRVALAAAELASQSAVLQLPNETGLPGQA